MASPRGIPPPKGLGEVRWAGHHDLHTKVSRSSGATPRRNNRGPARREKGAGSAKPMTVPIAPGGGGFLYLFLAASAPASLSPSQHIHSVFSLVAGSWGCCPHAQHRQWRSPGNLAPAVHKATFSRQWLQMALLYSGDPCPRVMLHWRRATQPQSKHFAPL